MTTRRARGSTLLETMMAGAVLILGMVGVIQLMIAGVTQYAGSNARATGQDMSSAGVAQVMALPFDAIATVGTYDAGIVFDAENRRYGRTMVVTDVGDGGVRARQILVRTEWREMVGAMSLLRTSQSAVIVSEVPDAAF